MTPDVVAEIENTDLPGCTYIRLSGGLDATNQLLFESHVQQIQKRGEGRFIVLDCKELKYVGSAISALVAAAEDLELRGGALLLVTLQHKVRVVFEMLGLLDYFLMFESTSSALDFVREWIATGRPPKGLS